MAESSDDLQLELDPASASAAAGYTPAVLVSSHAFNEMTQHALEEAEYEIGGIMLGSVIEGTGTVVIIEDVIRGTNMTHSRGSVTFTQETWTEINRVKDDQFPDKRVVGWYHSHPGFGIFLSNHDLFIHQNFFTMPWQVAFVTDPKAHTCGCFVWQDKEIIQDPDFAVLASPDEYLRRPAEPVAPSNAPATSQPSWQMPAPTAAPQRDAGLSWALGIVAMLVAMAVGIGLATFHSGRGTAANVQALNVKMDTIVRDLQELRSSLQAQPPAREAAVGEVKPAPGVAPHEPLPGAKPPTEGESGARPATPSP